MGGCDDFFDFVPLQDERAVDGIDEFGMVGRPNEAREGVESPVHLNGDNDAEEDGEDEPARVRHCVLVNYALEQSRGQIEN